MSALAACASSTSGSFLIHAAWRCELSGVFVMDKAKRPSIRKAINQKCFECTVDPLDAGSPARQIAACIDTDCPLHSVRPITCTELPLRLLEGWGVRPDQLDARARALVGKTPPTPADGRNGPLPGKEAISEGVTA